MGKNRYNAYHREYQLDRYHKRRDAAINLLGNKCTKCGTSRDLEIDHILPEDKKIKLSNFWTSKDFWKELKKCQLLCKNHHLEKTVADSIIHGSVSRYRKGCRCEPCSDIFKVRTKEHRDRYRAKLRVKRGGEAQ